MLHDRRPKWFYLISLSALLSTGVYFYYYPIQAGDINATFHPFVSQADETPLDFIKPGYFVYNDACRIAELPVRDRRMERYFTPEAFQSCDKWNHRKPRLVGSNRTHLFLIMSAVKYYLPENSTHEILECNYRPFTWKYFKGKSNEFGSIRAKYGKEQSLDSIVSPVRIITEEFIRVECSLNSLKVYTDFFAFVPEPETNSNTKQFQTETKLTSTSIGTKLSTHSTEDQFSVLIIGIDAVSRLNFQRQMPKSYKYLETHHDFLDMKGYNKIGDNTFPNLVAVLAGMSEKELTDNCWPTPKSTLDNCPFLWKNFSEKGFRTLYAEDAFHMSTFNYFKSGFKRSPTDYYFHIFSKESENSIGNTKLLNSNLCIGSQLVFKSILEYTLKFTTVLKNYLYFGLVWTVSLTHDFLNLPRVGDNILQIFLKNLNKNGNLNKTILILTSDHGLRWGEFRKTYQGHLEERLPFLLFILPEMFKAKYSLAYKNLVYNQHRLTTPYDLHETLLDLSNVTRIRSQVLKQRAREESKSRRGISLFKNIPDTRTCDLAGIPAHYCTCHNKMVPTSLKSPIIVELSRILVAHINKILMETSLNKCHPLKVHQVVTAYYEQPVSFKKKDNWTQRDYTISVMTVPGLATFEATMRYNTVFDSKDIIGDVSRLNLYANQSSCVDDARLKLYCYCR
ncbi:hypothetical protein WDU94_008688 [Cyamophila willieti]